MPSGPQFGHYLNGRAPYSQNVYILIMVKVKTLAYTKAEAYRIERAIRTAIDSGDYEFLDAASRSVCMKLFGNQQSELPPGLCRTVVPTEELIL